MPEESNPSVAVHLIDVSDGRSLQTWCFTGHRITIGRGETESIPLADPYVSRLHAELTCTGGVWRIIARGRNGIFIDGKSVDDCKLDSGVTFRLGAIGPVFRFDHNAPSNDEATAPLLGDKIALALDHGEVHDQAEDIAKTEYFRELQQKARRLRRQRQERLTDST